MEKCYLKDILGHYNKFFIPNYQRDYAWEVENFTELWGDLEESLALAKESPQDKEHYLGTIVLAPHNQNEKEVDVIDGQQRITTIFMILLALWKKVDDAYRAKKGEGLLHYDKKLKLQVGENNRAFLEEILKSAGKTNLPSEEQLGTKPTTQGQNNLYGVFDAILCKVNDFNEKKAKEYFDNLLEMRLIPFVEKSEGQAIRTFQSVNDRGVPLRLLDKLKALLIYYSNRYCEGEKGLDSHINECFGEIFRISNKISEHGYCSAFFSTQSNTIDSIESDVFRYHIGSKKFAGESFGIYGYYNTNSEDRYSELKNKMQGTLAKQDNLKEFLNDYSEDLKKFFEAILRILDKCKDDPVMFKAILIENLHTVFYNTFVRLEIDGKLNDEMITLFTKADCILKKFNDIKADPYYLITAYYETQDIELLKSKIYEICKKHCSLDKINTFVDYTAIGSRKGVFHYLFIEQKEKNLDIGFLKAFKNPTLEHIISRSVLEKNDLDTIKNKKKFENPEDLEHYIHTYGNLLSLERSLNEAAKDQSDIIKRREYEKSALPFVRSFDPTVVNKPYIIAENDKMKRWLKEEFFKDFL